ncbi:cytochrome P450 [Coniochaeta ligniaria NRRL 30616]|uniref:Cytochrome P450 n=1 Tax=Coniochaeta ligniaria NRRL 30616 TaxID=1408157 RepID=A0A1J7INC9_9PEZI|nr:cytochrome P450 [Coniochaeta ligniaria NRRL 30616]
MLFGLALIVIVPYALYAVISYDKRRRKLPPGPRGLPIIGNLLDLADAENHTKQVMKWAKEYGDIVHVQIGGSDFIFLNSPQVVKDLLDKRSNIYSSRPEMPVANEAYSNSRRQLFMPYSPEWRSVRKLSHGLLSSTAAQAYKPVQELESRQLLHDILDTPQDFYQHNRRYSASVIMTVTYGSRLPSWDDPLMTSIYSVLDNFTEMIRPGRFVVEAFPRLKHLPEWMLGNWRTYAAKKQAHDAKVYLGLWRDMKDKVEKGTAPPCYCRDFYLQNPDKFDIDEELSAYTAGGLVEAGSETTGMALNNFILAMIKWPEVLKRGQEEIDRVVGPGRLPDWDDEAQLPYVRAIVKECLRWRPITRTGMVHSNTVDDWYEGYFIPKGSTVILNWWAIHYNPTLHPDPDTFNPSRYLASHPEHSSHYFNTADPYDRDHFGYGAGRRICPGSHVAEYSLYINLARVLWAFDIGPKIGDDGKPVPPAEGFFDGVMAVPRPFECEIRPRSEGKAEMVREMWSQVRSSSGT